MVLAPQYRAKKLDSDEWVEGYLTTALNQTSILEDVNKIGTFTVWEVDPLTLSIHLPNMIDSNNNKIFASLSEDGKGGDIVNGMFRYHNTKHKSSIFKGITIVKNGAVDLKYTIGNHSNCFHNKLCIDLKVVGINK